MIKNTSYYNNITLNIKIILFNENIGVFTQIILIYINKVRKSKNLPTRPVIV